MSDSETITNRSDHDGHDNPLVTATLQYARRGWRVYQLHTPKSDGGCSCCRDNCRQGGEWVGKSASVRQAEPS